MFNLFVKTLYIPVLLFFPDMPCMKRVHKDKKTSVHWSAARNKKHFSSRG